MQCQGYSAPEYSSSLTRDFTYKSEIRKHPSVPAHKTCGCWHSTCQQIPWASKWWSQEHPSAADVYNKGRHYLPALYTVSINFASQAFVRYLCIHYMLEPFNNSLFTVPQAYIYCTICIPLPTNIFCSINLKFIYSLIETTIFHLKTMNI